MYHARLLPELLLDQPLPADAVITARQRLLARRVPPAVLVATLIAILGLDMLLMWRFVDFAPWWAYLLGIGAVTGLAAGAARTMRGLGEGPTLATLGVCCGAALLLYLLGGEGRFFYSNVDWQTRDGVLHDMASHPWPYAYLARGLPEILRAPIGMYLLPALAMAAGGQKVGDCALLLQNCLLLALLLGLSAQLFATPRKRAIALVVVLFFSGLDWLGAEMLYPLHGVRIPDHLEWWSGLEYSSNITLAFWVPQHALAGWICAVGYMLWRERRMPLGVMLMLVPLAVLWSPLGTLGALPFAALAGGETLIRRELRWPDLALPGAATLAAIPVLLYVSAAGDTVGARLLHLWPTNYILFELYEVVPFLVLAITARCPQRFGWPATLMVFACLLAMPFWQIGWSADFMLRASIPSLAILSVLMADLLVEEPRRHRRITIACVLAIGALTGWHEIRRALIWQASPPPLCTFFHTWGPSKPSDKNTYLAAVERLPRLIRPATVTLVPDRDPPHCWVRPWLRPLGA